MKKLLCALLTLCLLLCACNTGKTIDDPNILTGIYAPVLTGLGTADTIAASSLVPWQDGYAYAVWEIQRTTDTYSETLSICHVAEDGAVTTIPVALDRLGQSYMAGARGVYTFVLGEVKKHYDLVQIDWDGNVVARVDVTEQKPTGATTTTPKAATIYTDLPIAETETGLVIAWGKALLCYDHTLTYTGTIELPGTADTVFAEDDVLWISYTEKDARILGKAQDGAVVESYPLPE